MGEGSIYYYAPQRITVERYAYIFGIPTRKFRAVYKDCNELRGVKEGIFWQILGHREHITSEIYTLLRVHGFELVIFDDSYHRDYYNARQS